MPLTLLRFLKCQHLQLRFPGNFSPTASSPTPPIQLSYLYISASGPNVGPILEKVLEGSKDTLATLSIRGLGLNSSAVTATVAIVARIPLPSLRHLISSIHYNGIPTLLQLLPLLPSLHSLTIKDLNEPLTSVLQALPPSLSTLRLDWNWVKDPTLALGALRLSLARAGALRQLYLDVQFQARVADAAWGEFEAECAGRGVRLGVGIN